MGCSNPHPHGQIRASYFVPNEPAIEDRSQRDYLHERKPTMLVDYAQREMKMDERVVVSKQSLGCGRAFLGRLAL
jgi:UDPglucose--hexose-1-phosphate uridylyltransferase